MPSESKEKLLELSNGLTLAYEEAGDTSSTNVVIFFHGIFGVGAAPSSLPPALASRQFHYIAPTLPGWGNSSPVPTNVAYHDHLYRCVTALLQHTHPHPENLRLYLAGGSFGTVPAQILYGAPYDKFPLGRHIVAVLLIAPFSPFHCHQGYAKCLSWVSWLGVGPPAKIVPFHVLPRLGVLAIRGKISTPEGGKSFINEFVFKDMKSREREAFRAWKERKGLKDGEELDEMADGVYRSMLKTTEGFVTTADVLHSGWGGYSPAALDGNHAKPVFMVLTREDRETRMMGEWLASQLKSSLIRYEEGGHLGSLFVMDSIWEDFMQHYY
ncbi:Alpha/Beta hydrolase protein [Irpex lacteus]|nr:Alpha/Beta hydrolase protein [Irpex lacteus]